jgi:hypothetical protein
VLQEDGRVRIVCKKDIKASCAFICLDKMFTSCIQLFLKRI